jgi:sarcosine oxidase
MRKVFDVIVLGLGANGSSALYNLSKTNKHILGIDRFTPPHTFGSSHGQSRIIRQAYHESPFYVPFVKEAYNLWHEIEAVSGKQLLLTTGGIMLGSEDASVVTGSKLSADTYNIAYEYLDFADLQKRFPAFKITPGTVGVLEKEAGILFPEDCIKAYLEQAGINGAEINFNEKVIEISPKNDHVEIITDQAVYFTEKLIVSAGAWMNELLPGITLPLSVERQVLYWFKNKDRQKQQDVSPQNLPVYIWEYEAGKMFYGFPDLGDGIKIALHHAGAVIRPDELSQEVSEAEIDEMRAITGNYLNIDPEFNSSAVCMYTNTPDENFIIDHHPLYKNIIIASPCSGHGFKFSSFTGKILSDMALDNNISFDLSEFALNRPALNKHSNF